MVGNVDVGRELKHGGATSVSEVYAVELEVGIVSQESNMLKTWLKRSIFVLLLVCFYGRIDSLKTTCC